MRLDIYLVSYGDERGEGEGEQHHQDGGVGSRESFPFLSPRFHGTVKELCLSSPHQFWNRLATQRGMAI